MKDNKFSGMSLQELKKIKKQIEEEIRASKNKTRRFNNCRVIESLLENSKIDKKLFVLQVNTTAIYKKWDEDKKDYVDKQGTRWQSLRNAENIDEMVQKLHELIDELSALYKILINEIHERND